MCYKQKCKVVSLNLAHPVYLKQTDDDWYLPDWHEADWSQLV